MAVTAAYLVHATDGPREPMDWTPEFSRRARGVPVYATLRALGRAGVAELVDRLCECADRFADRLAATDGFEVVAHGLNQVLVRVRRRRHDRAPRSPPCRRRAPAGRAAPRGAG